MVYHGVSVSWAPLPELAAREKCGALFGKSCGGMAPSP
jgi:hypothetical protein